MALSAVRVVRSEAASARRGDRNAVLVRHSVFPPVRRMRAWGG